MFYIKDKVNCCGCSACVEKCPKQCLEMREDGEGFLYPQLKSNDCIDCGLCEKVCPILSSSPMREPLRVLAAKNTNEQERINSSSGGLFIALAKQILQHDGVVFGAVYDKNWEVHHVAATRIEDVHLMMGSKYVQSRIESTYTEALQILKTGRLVMFVGSPCQIAGLKTFLRGKSYPNLLAVDFVCHGVPSPGVWRQYLAETYSHDELERQCRLQATAGKNSVLLSSLNAKSSIGNIKFRDKTESGWKKYRFVVRKKSVSKADQNTVLSSDIHYENTYMRGFLSNVYLRPSCYGCKCKNGKSHSDLTLADYWGINVVSPAFDDDKGVGLVLVNSAMGEKYFNSLDLDIMESNLNTAKQFNPGFESTIQQSQQRKRFYSMLGKGEKVEDAVQKCFTPSLFAKCKMKAKRVIKIILAR